MQATRRASPSSSNIGGLPDRVRFEGVPCWFAAVVYSRGRSRIDLELSSYGMYLPSSSIWHVHVMELPGTQHASVRPGWFLDAALQLPGWIMDSLLLRGRIVRAATASRNLTMTSDGGAGGGRLMALMKFNVSPYPTLSSCI